MSGREIFARGLYVSGLCRETFSETPNKILKKKNIRLTYIGATTGVGTGVGKHLCNLLIIKLGVRGVTKQQSCVYTRTCVRERCKGEMGHTKTKKPRLIWGWAGAFFMNVSVCASGGHVGHKVTTAY